MILTTEQIDKILTTTQPLTKLTVARAFEEAIVAALAEKDTEIARLTALINSPEILDFGRAVTLESAHQRERFGVVHDGGKTPADWFWLVGYLAGKALHSQAAGDLNKSLHHVITTAAACANWHSAMLGKTDMRPGIDATAIDTAAAPKEPTT